MRPAIAVVKMGGENENGVRRNNNTLLCAPIIADDIDHMLVLMNLAKSYVVDLVEIRLDSLKHFLEGFNVRESIQSLVKLSPLPTLFTYR